MLKTIDIIVKVPLNSAPSYVKKMEPYVVKEILKRRDWRYPPERKMTFKPKDYKESPHENIAEFKTYITSDMTKDDLAELAARFSGWLKR